MTRISLGLLGVAGLATVVAAGGALARQGQSTGAGGQPASAGAGAGAHSVAPPIAASRLGRGYLAAGTVPDSLLLNPLPPAAGSAALARDEEGARAALALQGSARWAQARIDADLFTPAATSAMSCAAGVAISAATTPRLDALLRKAGPDFGMAVYPTKRKYQRARPFVVNGKSTCTPEQEQVLRQDGSYPSGHSAIGYGWGLILAEVVPDRAAQVVARGRAFGDSRRICNVHWLSDIEEGRVVATAVFARLDAEPAFRADVEAARAEVAALRAKTPAQDCARETAALGTS